MKKLPVFVLLCLLLCATSFANVNDLAVETSSENVSIKVNSFCHAIVKGDLETVKKMIALGEDVNQKSNGMSPLMYAARYNKTAIVELLIEKGANLKATSSKGYTAHKYALLSNASDAAKIIEQALKKRKKKKRNRQS